MTDIESHDHMRPTSASALLVERFNSRPGNPASSPPMRHLYRFLPLTFFIFWRATSTLFAEDSNVAEPATVAAAAAVIDLSKFEPLEGSDPPLNRTLASVAYQWSGNSRDAYAREKALLE